MLAVAAVIAAIVAGWWLRSHGPAPLAATVAVRGSSGPLTRRETPQRTGEVGAPARVLIDDDPVGALRLEGQVVDAADHGVGGATVVLSSNPPRTALTEADGSFAFEGLVGRPYTLLARAAQGVAGPLTARLTERSDPVVLRLRAAAKLTVSVVGTDGKAIDGATVELRGLDVQRSATRAGQTVFAPVAPGPYQIAAWADGMAHSFQRIQIGAGDAEAHLRLASGAPVRGRVVDERGAGVANARVRYSGASDWGQQAANRLDGAVTAADGSFQFDALPAGSFRFVASHPERAPGTSALVTLDGKTPRDGVVVTMALGAVVTGRVVDAQRRPVASARVRIAPAGDPPRMAFDPPRQAYSDAQGRFEVKGLPRKPLSAVALHEIGSSLAVAIDASTGDVAEVTLIIDVTGTIAGTVVDPQGQPVEGAQVSAAPGFGGGRGGFDPQSRLRGPAEALSDAGGKFTLTGLTAGTYRVSASTARARTRGRGSRDGTTAQTGDTAVQLVLEPDGSVKGRVAFADGSAPDLFTVGAQQVQQSFTGGDGSFVLDGLAPARHELVVRGPSFQTRTLEVTVEASRTADAGTITVVKGRTIAGTVVADGQPVADATVYAGRTVFGNGTTSSAQPAGGLAGGGAFGAGTKTTTTDAGGGFLLSGFGDGDLTVVAEHDAIGRSRALRLPTLVPGQTELAITLEKFGSLGGVLHQGAKPVEGVVVTCQSTSTPGAIYAVPAGADGAFRFDRLAPDTYKVSATVGTPIAGMRFYSKQVDVPAGQQVTVDLSVDAGTVALDLAVTARTGRLNLASAWVASGALTAKTANELSLKLAAAGAGASQRVVARGGEPAHFTELTPGGYTACVTPFPVEVNGFGAIGYAASHGDTLPAYCQPVTIAPSPDHQTAAITVEIPPYIPDSSAPGNGGPGGPRGGSGSPGPGSSP